VWEVLYGGLKNKIEIQWYDIISLKANYPDDGPGTLDIVVISFFQILVCYCLTNLVCCLFFITVFIVVSASD